MLGCRSTRPEETCSNQSARSNFGPSIYHGDLMNKTVTVECDMQKVYTDDFKMSVTQFCNINGVMLNFKSSNKSYALNKIKMVLQGEQNVVSFVEDKINRILIINP